MVVAGEIAAVGRTGNGAVDTLSYRNADPSSRYSRQLETRRRFAERRTNEQTVAVPPV